MWKPINNLYPAIVCTAGILISIGCSPQSEAPLPANVVAVIGDRSITVDALALEAARRAESGLPPLSRDDLLERMLLRESLLLRARSEGLLDDPAVLREMERVLISRVKEREVAPRREQVVVTDEEVAQAYQERIQNYTKPALNRFAMLYLKKSKSDSAAKIEETRGRMAEAYSAAMELVAQDQYEPSSGFGDLSVRFSDDVASRYRGGDLGWVADVDRSTRAPVELLKQAMASPLGEVRPIAETDDGFYLVMRTDEQASRVAPFSTVEAALKRRLTREKQDAVEALYYETCLRDAEPRINVEALERLDPPAPEAPTTFPTMVSGN